MTALQLKPRYPRPTFYRKPVKTFADNWLNQRFNVQAKNQVWAGDITYVYTAEGRLYLAVVIDLYSRQIVGWSCSDEINTALCEQARLAIQRRASETGLSVSFGQRGRYSSRAFRQCPADFGIKQS
ncbi:DDE-type integrase/transposase/recombinase [Aggregatibacter actinomycetemcomitans]|uniref:DDE-type integrase/transposase/recombinase n=1 Tax=Aggregatibacter actinomycetemcomitans TaxID=714 RepID=UPI00022ABDFB|nr:DDE-type integrase/transposase/recombinase [Aggregatibacter actinomycetemcomitans]KOE65422.1 transposase [Aggregatibacter actinomycetemcomitans serotype e str. SCC393]KOE67889.1 transposase [Aggregatibacter actinomycetemcomitans serotype e str. A160]KYK76028.1 transposase [Aggregatibacter actinomycetemcomitans serotype e str. SA2876]